MQPEEWTAEIDKMGLDRQQAKSGIDILFENGKLTKDEEGVARLTLEHMTAERIAGILRISPRTVEKHRANIRKKLDLPRNYKNRQ